MSHQNLKHSAAKGIVRMLRRHEELPLLRDHLLRLDPRSRRGFLDDGFIERYAAKCAGDGTAIIAYVEDGLVRGAAELHPPAAPHDSEPEIAFSVEANVRRRGVGSRPFRELLVEAHRRGHRILRITTGADNEAMQALALRFGAHLRFRHGETAGTIDLTDAPLEKVRPGGAAPFAMAWAMLDLNRAWWKALLRIYGWRWAA